MGRYIHYLLHRVITTDSFMESKIKSTDVRVETLVGFRLAQVKFWAYSDVRIRLDYEK